ncbi:hypothetical protein OG455_31215 [Kitasatospora sp. NBC_01287]|uniref:hypothetical protein n=1 Tax=Kitasatospora sp. NBC_01287 TaxID=2903573 RepID=UPI002252E8DD|nr:hypothetical protein [Kitasatospora sp. NBC_01287]MCX4749936.1 hypothetical protein [Kitasatospora sp. NBC_01287]
MDTSAYRMLVESGHDYVSTGSIADAELRAWLAAEGVDLLAPGIRLDVDSEANLHGAYTRWRLRESRPEGLRQTTLLVRARVGDAAPWVRLEAEQLPAVPGAHPAWSPAPGLAAPLLTALRARDGAVAVTAAPAEVRPGDLPRVLAELREERRRLPIVVLAVPPALAAPLTRELPGLAVAYLLTPEAEPAFNRALAHHPVPVGGARTYLPGVEPDRPADVFRHPVTPGLPHQREHAAQLLARLPRRLAARTPLPAELATVPALRTRPAAGADRDELARLRADNTVLNGLLDEAAHEEGARLKELGELRLELREQEEHAFELSVELAERAAELRGAEAQLRDLQRDLAALGAPGAAVRLSPRVPHHGPGGFETLLDRIGELPELRFTGSRRVTVELDAQALGADWAATAWDALLALQDYARAKRQGEHLRDFLHWCRDTPPGGHRFPPGKVVRDESPQTAGRKAWRLQRTFPVPAAVDPSGTVFMGAHLRIGAGHGKAPRLHFHDASAHGGLIYLGYLGPHLDNTLSSGI